MFFTVKEVEGYPEFWEEIIVRDWEILQFKSNGGRLGLVIGGGFSGKLLKHHIENKSTIYSVKRLSDDTVFTVGDTVKQKDVIHNNIFKITGFTMDVNNKHLLAVGNGGIKLHKIEHYQKIFTTRDGVDIFEGDTYYIVNEDFSILEIKCGDTCVRYHPNSYNPVRYSADSYICGKRQTALEFVLMNKPCLSINDIFSVGKRIIVDEGKLKQLVKAKL